MCPIAFTRRSRRSRRVARASAVAFAVLGLVPAAAAAAPDWTAAADYPIKGPGGTAPEAAFAGDGTATLASTEVKSKSPLSVALHLQSRAPGGPVRDQLVIPSTSTIFPTDAHVAVAPDGTAVAVWQEFLELKLGAPARFRAAYRPRGSQTWEPPATIGTEPSRDEAGVNEPYAAISSNGTAAIVIHRVEPNAPDEPGIKQVDSRIDVATHPRGGSWTSATRITPVDKAALGVEADFDGAGNLTVAWAETVSEGPTTLATDDVRRLVVRRRTASNGNFGPPEVVAGGAGDGVRANRLDVNESGAAVLTWAERGGAQQRTGFATRSAAADTWTTLAPLDPGEAGNTPEGAGIAPDGTAYVPVYRAQEAGPDCVDAIRIRRQTRTTSKCISMLDDLRAGSVAIAGNDAVFAWNGTTAGEPILQGSHWPAGRDTSDAATTLDASSANLTLADLQPDGTGGVAAIWTEADGRTRAAAFDAGAPRIDASAPRTAVAGSPVAFSARAVDLWSPLSGAPAWDFGDGTKGTGAKLAHAFARPGTYRVTVRSTDARGNTSSRSFPISVAAAPAATGDGTAPAASIARPKCPRKASRRKCARLRSTRKAYRIVRGTVSDGTPSSGIASVELTVTGRTRKGALRVAGRKVLRGRKGKPIKATVRGSRWSVRLPKLPAGRWTFRVVARDRAGNASRARALTATLR